MHMSQLSSTKNRTFKIDSVTIMEKNQNRNTYSNNKPVIHGKDPIKQN